MSDDSIGCMGTRLPPIPPTTPGPDSLREIAHALRQKDAYIFLNMTAGKVDAHADAWEAERAENWAETERLLVEVAALRKRLEEAEKYLRLIGHGEEWAALEEKPPGEKLLTAIVNARPKAAGEGT
jgi:hypothetical protein